MGTLTQLAAHASAREAEPKLYISVSSAVMGPDMSHIDGYYTVTGDLFVHDPGTGTRTTLIEEGTWIFTTQDMESMVDVPNPPDFHDSGEDYAQEYLEFGGYELAVRLCPAVDEVSLIGVSWLRSTDQTTRPYR